ncbi:TolC family protein, partial [Pantoea sp. GbtcB22]|uniref:TolC family protein n=1 Tax=Pantoea sp. GbtcB22 TaxID=2824767 RepID=UPI001C2F1690
QIGSAEPGPMPTLDLSASTGMSNSKYGGSRANQSAGSTDSITGSNQAGLSFTMPLYSGGSVSSQGKLAEYNYVAAIEQLEG